MEVAETGNNRTRKSPAMLSVLSVSGLCIIRDPEYRDAGGGFYILPEQVFEKCAHDIYLSGYATVKDMLAETKGELTETKAELAEAREALADGKAQGKQLGEMRVNRLIKILGEEGRIDDILRAAEDSEFQEKLFKKYGL